MVRAFLQFNSFLHPRPAPPPPPAPQPSLPGIVPTVRILGGYRGEALFMKVKNSWGRIVVLEDLAAA